ncbi:DUF2007 domain-containing protein [Heliobacterium chlorum]|uniref:DUF2007 domain-containing protein n=1 Tax=Heliobacterium chlorum TaxID=2698 RepID=A0ABR7T8J1_HELCL|nr:DUF2007 domain-containing protein [Heliobacterium chlorum]MBC9785931.1 DUF2007 domain-containing protein [Heliobacterium chlorum]
MYKDTWIHLINVADVYKAEIVESILREANIPFQRKYAGTDGYLKLVTGGTLNNIELYVPDIFYDDAINLVSVSYEEDNSGDETYQQDKSYLSGIILIAIAFSILYGLFMVIADQ